MSETIEEEIAAQTARFARICNALRKAGMRYGVRAELTELCHDRWAALGAGQDPEGTGSSPTTAVDEAWQRARAEVIRKRAEALIVVDKLDIALEELKGIPTR